MLTFGRVFRIFLSCTEIENFEGQATDTIIFRFIQSTIAVFFFLASGSQDMSSVFCKNSTETPTLKT